MQLFRSNKIDFIFYLRFLYSLFWLLHRYRMIAIHLCNATWFFIWIQSSPATCQIARKYPSHVLWFIFLTFCIFIVESLEYPVRVRWSCGYCHFFWSQNINCLFLYRVGQMSQTWVALIFTWVLPSEDVGQNLPNSHLKELGRGRALKTRSKIKRFSSAMLKNIMYKMVWTKLSREQRSQCNPVFFLFSLSLSVFHHKYHHRAQICRPVEY